MPNLRHCVLEAVRDLTREHGQHSFGLVHVIGEIADPKPTPEDVIEELQKLADLGHVVVSGNDPLTMSVTLSYASYEGML